MSMKLKLSDINLMLDIISEYQDCFEREFNEEWHDEVESLRDRLLNIMLSKRTKDKRKV